MDRRAVLAVVVAVMCLGAVPIPAAARPLAPNQAFRFHAAIVHGALAVRWTAAPGYHIYRSRVHLAVAPRGVRLAPFHLPKGRWVNDPAFGHQQVYEGRTVLTIPFARAPGGRVLRVTSRYQGCANAGICYPPLTKTVVLKTPRAGIGPRSSPPAAPAPVSSIAASPAKITPPWDTLVLFLVAGLGLAFTPCVFPMIPILSATIVGQCRGRARPLTLSLAYVVGMAATYTAAGIIAALTGHYVQAAFQNPWVLSAFSALFVVLALCMFGLYDLQMPRAVQERLGRYGQGGQVLGTLVLGVFSALIVGPCVAAPLAGALLLISRTGDVVFGGLALLALSIGMGLPLLAIGTSAGHFLPKAGPWLDKIRAVFGLLMIAVAIWLEGRILPGPVTLGLWALLAIVGSVALGALEPLKSGSPGAASLMKGLEVAILGYGLVLGVGALSGATDPLAPLARLSASGIRPAARPRLTFQTIHDVRGLKAALAGAHGRPVLVDFWASWCVQCRRMDDNTFRDPRVVTALRSLVLVRADVSQDNGRTRRLLARLHAFGPPTLVYFNRHGARIGEWSGYEGPRALLAHITRPDSAAHTGPSHRLPADIVN
ncbi:protein-disulfide reductase DsbD [Acidiferrobacter sp. SPIII_3]|uniref:protein-disulfide reductase DsbD n=1 Tax=Acidiferrobacter sp. SPIII_3 TaxID=1281578 RepID=UPI00143DC655|nr:protein-disulfide reductase DsbD [Acidiferrobacter sp. SPIII_3]